MASTSHRHLPVAAASVRPVWDRARGLVLGLAALVVILFASSLGQTWWSFKLYAPQYPGGLTLDISLTGMGGDVKEIDLLNHYIGMGHLAEAAPVERRLAGWGVAAICVVTILAFAFAGRRWNRFVALPAIAFPIVFLADSFYWLHRFGHELSPKAPIKLAGFTPQMFGNGQIGQFETFATPALGFWLAVGGAACAIAAALVRARVCSGCARHDGCAVLCHRLMVLPGVKR